MKNLKINEEFFCYRKQILDEKLHENDIKGFSCC